MLTCIVLVALVAAGCGRELPVVYRALSWETQGGGDMAFTVTPAGADYAVHVTRRQFHPADANLILKRADQPMLFGLLAAIFSGKRDLGEPPPPKDPRLLTGTWTHVKMLRPDGSAVEIHDPKLLDALRPLYDFVAARVNG